MLSLVVASILTFQYLYNDHENYFSCFLNSVESKQSAILNGKQV